MAGAELPPLNEAIADYVKPDRALFEEAAPEVSAFEDAFKLEYVNEDENKKRQRVYWRDIISREEAKNEEEAKGLEEEERLARLKVESKGDGGFEFRDDQVKEITSVDPIGDFKKMVNDRKVDRVGEAVGQMQTMIERFVKNSLKGDLYEKAVLCLEAMRETCVKEDEAQKYNDFLAKIKRIFGGQRGSHAEFFQQLVAHGGLSLITQKESAISSNVTEQEAAQVKHTLTSSTLSIVPSS